MIEGYLKGHAYYVPYSGNLHRVKGSRGSHALARVLFDRLYWRPKFMVFVPRMHRATSFS
jgi:hypothetical protein